jgi:hypothetical protein
MRNFTVAAAFAFAITAMFALGPAKAQTLKSDAGKCWLNINGNRNPEWGACPREQSKKAPKASKVSAEPPRPRPAAEGGGGRY